MSVDLSLIIINYNSGKLLKECIRSIKKNIHDVNYEIIVVDNGSTDGSTDRIPEQFPKIHMIENKENVGFGEAANRGFGAAKGKYLMLMNPDVVYTDEEMKDLIDYMDDHPEVGIAGPKVFNDLQKESLQLSARRFPTFLNYLFSRHSPLTKLFPNNRYSQEFLMTDFDHDEIRGVDWVSGCCILFRSDMLEDIGYMDSNYHLFFEDVDICYRARQNDWEVMYYPYLEVVHYGGEVRAQKPFQTIVDRHNSLWKFYKKFYSGSKITSGLVFAGTYLRLIYLLALTAFKKISPLILDAALIQAGIVLSYLTRSLWIFPEFERAINSYINVAPWYTLSQLFLLYIFNLYSPLNKYYQDYLVILPQTIKAVTVGNVGLVFIAFFARTFYLPRSIVLLSWLFNIILLSAWRMITLYYLQRSKSEKRAIIYGTGELADLLNEELNRRVSLQYNPVGFIRPSGGNNSEITENVLGNLEDLEELTSRLGVDEVIYAPDVRSSSELLEVLNKCGSANLNTRIAPELFEIATGTIHLEHFDVPFLDPDTLPSRNWYFRTKRVIDLVLGSVMLVLTAPIMAIISLAVKLSSSGPILFRQNRVGKGGEEFTLFKFRTMYEDSTDGGLEGVVDDTDLEKMTPVGRFLRLTRLDEIPQLINVIKGEMSLVGPRAEWKKIAKKMEREIPFFHQRYLIRPGMTGWAQVEFIGGEFPTATLSIGDAGS